MKTEGVVKVRVRLIDVETFKAGNPINVQRENRAKEPTLPMVIVEMLIPLEDVCVVGTQIRLKKHAVAEINKLQPTTLRAVK